jgi:hypothetical protein
VDLDLPCIPLEPTHIMVYLVLGVEVWRQRGIGEHRGGGRRSFEPGVRADGIHQSTVGQDATPLVCGLPLIILPLYGSRAEVIDGGKVLS